MIDGTFRWLGAGLCWALVAFARAVGWVVGCVFSARVVRVSLVNLSLVVVGCFGLMPFSYIFRGGAVRFSFSYWALGSCILLVCGAWAFWK